MDDPNDFRWEVFWPPPNKRGTGLGYITRRLERAKIPGGWLVKFWLWSGSHHAAHAICFIPGDDQLWVNEHSELETVYSTRGVNTKKSTHRKRLGKGWLYIDAYYAAGSVDQNRIGHQSIDMVWVPDQLDS